MSRFSKIFSLSLAVVLAFGMFPNAARAWDTVFGDDFEHYSAGDMKGSAKDLNGSENWKSFSGNMGWDPDANPSYFGITNDTVTYDNNVNPVHAGVPGVGGNSSQMLYIQAKADINAQNVYPCVNLTLPDGTVGVNQRFGVDMFSPRSDIRLGIRLRVNGSDSNFYELLFVNGNSYRMKKNSDTVKIGTGGRNGNLPYDKWYRLEVQLFNGEITWQVYERDTMQQLSEYSGFYVDASLSANAFGTNTVSLLAAGAGGGSGYFDNFSIGTFRGPWEQNQEPSNQLYVQLNANKSEDETGVADLGCMSRIRKLSFTGVKSALTVSVSSDGHSYDELYAGTPQGEAVTIINGSHEGNYRYLKTAGSYEGLTVYNNLDDTLVIPVRGIFPVAGRFEGKDQAANTITWSSSDEAVFTVAGGILTGKTKGDAVLHAVCGTASLSVPVRVTSELEYYRSNGLETEYVNLKRIITDTANQAIRSQNADTMKLVLQSGTAASLEQISDIDFSAISGLDSTHLSNMVTALLSYEPFYGENETPDIDDIFAFIDVLNAELKVYELDHLATAAKVAAVMNTNHTYYGIDIQDVILQRYNELIYDRMTGMTFASVSALRTYVAGLITEFKENYVIDSLAGIGNFLSVNGFLTDFADLIGYNTEKYADIADKEAFAKAFMGEKSSFVHVAEVRSFIDDYKPVISTGGGSSSTRSKGGHTAMVELPPVIEQTAPVKEEASPFRDLTSAHWSYSNILFLNSRSIISGDETGAVHPDAETTRAEIVKMLLEALGMRPDQAADKAADKKAPEFTDVSQGDWYYPYMQLASRQGILLGSGGRGSPRAAVSRQELCALVYRALHKQGIELPETQPVTAFEDASQIADWSAHAVMRLKGAGLISGTPEGKFEPERGTTRAETAKILTLLIRTIETQRLKEADVNEK